MEQKEIIEKLAERWRDVKNGKVEFSCLDNYETEEDKDLARQLICQGIIEAATVIDQMK